MWIFHNWLCIKPTYPLPYDFSLYFHIVMNKDSLVLKALGICRTYCECVKAYIEKFRCSLWSEYRNEIGLCGFKIYRSQLHMNTVWNSVITSLLALLVSWPRNCHLHQGLCIGHVNIFNYVYTNFFMVISFPRLCRFFYFHFSDYEEFYRQGYNVIYFVESQLMFLVILYCSILLHVTCFECHTVVPSFMQHCSKLFLKAWTSSKWVLKGPTICFRLYGHHKVLKCLFWGNCHAHLFSLGLIFQSHVYTCACNMLHGMWNAIGRWWVQDIGKDHTPDCLIFWWMTTSKHITISCRWIVRGIVPLTFQICSNFLASGVLKFLNSKTDVYHSDHLPKCIYV
jgi:hypothetical protein